MKILFLSRSKNDYAQIRFREEARKRKIEIGAFNYSHLVFFLDSRGVKILAQGYNLDDFDIFIFRSPGLTKRYIWQEKVLVDWLLKKRKIVLNGNSLSCWPEDFDKLWQNYIFYLKKIPFVSTQNFGNPELIKKRKPPFIVKRLVGSLGRDLRLVHNQKELVDFLQRYHPFEFLAQEFLPTKEDFRLIVLGGRVLGAMKRVAGKNQLATNIAAGGRGEKVVPSLEMKNLALKVCQVFRCEFGGVDIMCDKQGNPYVLELNRYPVFKGFEKTTGVDVAGQVVDYLLEKWQKRK